MLDRPLAQATLVGADVDAARRPRRRRARATPQFDVAYEVSGNFNALKTCVAATKRGGVVVQVGTLPHEPLPFVVNELMAKELDLRGAFRWGIEFDWAVDYLSSRRVDVRPLLSGQYPLQDAVAAFAAAADKNKSTKVQVIAVAASRTRLRGLHDRAIPLSQGGIMRLISKLVSYGVAAAALVAAAPALAQPKLKWAHVYETSEPYHTASVWAAARNQEAHQRQVRHRRLPGLVSSARRPTSTRACRSARST